MNTVMAVFGVVLGVLIVQRRADCAEWLVRGRAIRGKGVLRAAVVIIGLWLNVGSMLVLLGRL